MVLFRGVFSALVFLLFLLSAWGGAVCCSRAAVAGYDYRSDLWSVEPWIPGDDHIDPNSPFAELSKRGKKMPWMWRAVPNGAKVRFVYTVDDREYEGYFPKFTTRIRFRPDDLETSFFDIKFSMRQMMFPNSVMQFRAFGEGWLDPRAYPEAWYTATKFVDQGNGYYIAKGLLKIRKATLPLDLRFRVLFQNVKEWPRGASVPVVVERRAKAVGEAVIDLRHFGIGIDDPETKGRLDPFVKVKVNIEAERAPVAE